MAERVPLGQLVVLEGPSEVGKTTIACALAHRLTERGALSEMHAFPGRIRGTLGSHVYRLHHAPSEMEIDEISPTALQALHVAAHLDSIERLILPKLSSGINVILDRYWWSTIAYGAASGVPRAVLTSLLAPEIMAWEGCRPTLAMVLDRDQPGLDQAGETNRLTLQREYRELVDAAKGVHPAFLVKNNGSIDGTIDLVADLLRRTGSNLGAVLHAPPA